MLKIINVLVVLLISISSFSQEIDTDYFPEYNNTVTMSDYNRGKHLLENAYSQISDPAKVHEIDYWNVAFAFSYMGIEKNIVFDYLKKSKTINSENFCAIANRQIDARKGLSKTPFYKLLGERYAKLICDCEGVVVNEISIEQRIKEKEKLDLSKYNEKVIDILIRCMDKDQRYRASSSLYANNRDKQTILDREIQEEMNSVFEEFGYPGKDLVGEIFMDYACLFIEHGGELNYQEKYLPLVAEAYKNDQVSKPYLKMLIDRIHWKKNKKQVFGSHMGIDFESSDIIKEVKKKYDL